MTKRFKGTPSPVPEDVAIVAANATGKHFNCCADSWEMEQVAYYRKLLPVEHHIVCGFILLKQAVSLRKAGKLAKTRNGK